jgi:hypothetical protein
MVALPYFEAASTPEYRSAYDKVMGAAGDTLTDAEREAIAEVRRLAGTAIGLPVPPALPGRGRRPQVETRIEEGA